jgi:hypothetical protein
MDIVVSSKSIFRPASCWFGGYDLIFLSLMHAGNVLIVGLHFLHCTARVTAAWRSSPFSYDCDRRI